MKIVISLAALITLIFVSACENQDRSIVVGGSTSVVPLMEMFVVAYQEVMPEVEIRVNGTGSGDGIRGAGDIHHIGISSRELTPAEQGRGLTEIVIAIDGIAVIVHRDNPISDLTVEQIRAIYTGEITDWSDVGGNPGTIAVVSREAGSGTRGAFEEMVGFQGALVAGASESTSTGAVRASVTGNPNAIGYISIASVDDTVQSISVGGYAPTVENVRSGAYRISRPFILLTGGNITSEGEAFVDWILSPEGQAIVSRNWVSVR